MEPQQIFRLFRGTDGEMLEAARTTQVLLSQDLVAFTTFDATIDGAFVSTFLDAITDAEAIISDNVVIDELVEKTENVETAMERARIKYREVKYFAQAAFPNSIGIQNQFGLNDYDRARKSTTQMIAFLEDMYSVCQKFNAKLIDSGYSQVRIDEIKDIRENLLQFNSSQEVFKKTRTKLTEDRITVLNNCYNYMTKVNAAAQLVYMNDYAKQKQFVYNASSDADKNIDQLEGTVDAGITQTITSAVFDDAIYTFRNTGVAPLTFCLSETEEVSGVEVNIGGGAIITKVSAELDPDAVAMFLLVRNDSDSESGSYEITIEA